MLFRIADLVFRDSGGIHASRSGGERIRTADLCVANAPLSHLSYTPLPDGCWSWGYEYDIRDTITQPYRLSQPYTVRRIVQAFRP